MNWFRKAENIELRPEMEEYIPFEVYSGLHKMPSGFDTGIISSPRCLGQRGGAGILIFSPELNEILLLERSDEVLEPGRWGIPGGTREKTPRGMEDSIITAVSESYQEMGGLPPGKIRKEPYAYYYPGSGFTYDTFILEIDPKYKDSFVPQLNWENTSYNWFMRNSLNNIPLHPGVEEVLANYRF